MKEYLIAIATKTLSTNIVAASKIAQNRFCCYLNDEKLVDELTKEGNNVIVIKGHSLTMRPYVSKAKRVIFSNVHPCIPHDEITGKLKEYNVIPKSNLSFIRLGLNDPGFTQIVSFRRQLFIDPDDVNKLPKEFTINYDETLYHIFVSTDKISCFLCNKEGHTARYCPSKDDNYTGLSLSQPDGISPTQQSELNSETIITAETSNSAQNSVSSKDIPANGNDTNDSQGALGFQGTPLFKTPTIVQKRNISSNTSNESSINDKSKQKETGKKSPKKKKTVHKKEPPVNLQTQIETAVLSVDVAKSATFPITHEKLTEFLIDTYEIKYNEVKTISSKYVDSNASLIVMLREVYNSIESADVKGRITRIINNLGDDKMDTDGDDVLTSDSQGD